MATREIKDAKDLTTNELFYFKGHAKATYMSNGDTVENAVNSKVDKVEGKQLSTEDFTTALKNKLNGLSNYDDTTISQAVEKLRTDLDTLVSGDTTTAIKTFNEVIAFLDGIQDSQDLSSIIASIEQQIAGKMDSVTLAKVATSGSYNDLADKPTIPSAVTENTVSGWGFTKNTGTYNKPSTGIPKTDLANDVQNSLEKADSSVQYAISGEAIIENGILVDGQRGVFYALPSADDDAKANADYIIATDVELNGKQDKINDLDKIRSGAAKGATSTQQEVLQTGASAVVVPDGVFVDGGGSTYALPDVAETTKEASDYVLATEDYVDSKVGSGGDSETIKVLTETDPVLIYQGELKNNFVYIINQSIGYLEIGNLAFSVHTNDFEKFTMIFTTKTGAIFDGVSFPADWQWANGVAPNVEKGVTYELSVTYIKFGNSVKYNAILTPFKTV